MYDNQQKSRIEQVALPSSSQDIAQRSSYCLILKSMLIGALVAGIVLGVILAIYIKEQSRTTTTTTTTTTSTTSTSTSTSTTSTSTSATTTSTSSSTSATTTTMLPLVPPGVILLWSGSIAMIPYGWVVCDGTQGTPDLRNRFIIGSGSSALYAPTQVGGASSVTPSITVDSTTLTVAQMPSHSHGGSTGIEDVGQIYYDVNSSPCTSGPFGSSPPRWINTKNYNTCNGCQHQHPITSEGGDQPHAHTAAMTPIDITPPFMALLYIMKL